MQLPEADLHRLRAALVKKRDELVRVRAATERERRGIAAPETESGDIAERLIEQESALRIGAHDAELLRDVERALEKIEAGTYGTSEETGEPIPIARLDALPWARR
jgi:DnaK suppressor protein